MSYQIAITKKAEIQLDEAKEWWSRHHSSQQAARWYSEFSDAILSLKQHPQRCSLAAENEQFPYEIRELHFGLGSRPTHRAVFTIRPEVVVILIIRHSAQDDITADDL